MRARCMILAPSYQIRIRPEAASDLISDVAVAEVSLDIGAKFIEFTTNRS